MRYSARDAAVYLARARRMPGGSRHRARLARDLAQLAFGEIPAPRNLGARLARRAPAGHPRGRQEIREHRLRLHRDAARGDREAARAGRAEPRFHQPPGYRPVLACEACGWTAACTRCTARMVLHSADRCLRCHHCGAQAAVPEAVRPAATWISSRSDAAHNASRKRCRRAFQAPVSRASTATARGGAASWRERSKGCGAARATSLSAPSFSRRATLPQSDPGRRAERRYRARIHRLPGRRAPLRRARSGGGARGPARASGGGAGADPRYPGHPLFAALARHDFASFAESQLEERRSAGFPPFVFEAALRAEATKLDTAMHFLRTAAALADAPEGVHVYDPVPNILTRRAGLERAQLVIQSRSRPALQAYLSAISTGSSSMRRARCAGTSTSTRSSSTEKIGVRALFP